MKAPHHERRALLDEAIRSATDAMAAPIDRIVVTNRYVRCWSGSCSVTLAYCYRQGGIVDPDTGRFQAGAGSGHWSVSLVSDDRKRGVLGRLRALLLR